MTSFETDEAEVIRSLLVDQLGNVVINSVSTEADIDADGDPVWRITVILETPTTVDRKKLAGLVRVLRSKLTRDIFPVIRFVAKSEAHKLHLEAA